jgi:hypothetical protein
LFGDPESGWVWQCSPDVSQGLAGWAGVPEGEEVFYVPDGETPVMDPAVIAARAVDRLPLAVPEIGMAPMDPQRTTVGLETWLWVPEEQWDGQSLTVTAAGGSVTVTAAPVRVDWDLTEGSTSCFSPGRVWVRGMSGVGQTDCGYTFSTVSQGAPEGKYSVSATIVYEVSWTCSGVCLSESGDLGEVSSVSSSTAIEVIERQTVVKVG